MPCIAPKPVARALLEGGKEGVTTIIGYVVLTKVLLLSGSLSLGSLIKCNVIHRSYKWPCCLLAGSGTQITQNAMSQPVSYGQHCTIRGSSAATYVHVPFCESAYSGAHLRLMTLLLWPCSFFTGGFLHARHSCSLQWVH